MIRSIKKLIILLLLSISAACFPGEVFAQEFKNYLKAGDEALKVSDFYGAAFNFKKAIEIDSSLNDLNYKYAEVNLRLLDFPHAEKWFDAVVKADNGKNYPEAIFWLAMSKKSQGKYKEAKKLFDRYLKKFKKKKTYFTLKATNEIGACDYAMLAKASPSNINIHHADTAINSTEAEYAPFQINDSVLFFSSVREIKKEGLTADQEQTITKSSRIYSSDLNENYFSKSKLLPALFNSTDKNISNSALSMNKKRFYFSQCGVNPKGENECDIYVSTFDNGIWGSVEKLNSEINQPGSSNTHPSVGMIDSIGEVLFFSSNRQGGEGKFDIYMVPVSKEGNYGSVNNVGNTINTMDDDITPFFCNPCQILYFSSEWHKGLGGFDIFQAKVSKGKFDVPVNPGAPLNSSYNDLYFSLSPSGDRAYLSSNRPGSMFVKNETCCNDIYYFNIPVDKKKIPEPVDSAKVFIIQMKLLVPLTLYFHNDEPDNKTLNIVTQKNYKKTFDDYIQMREKYRKEYSKGLSGEAREKAEEDIETFFEDSVSSGFQDLEKFAQLLVKVLKEGEDVKITMKGYCSPLASTNYNVNLAKRRISSLRNYFMEYDNGVLKPYTEINSRPKLDLVDEEVGELTETKVSDNPNDLKNAIYSKAAALERKIQIIAVSSKTFK